MSGGLLVRTTEGLVRRLKGDPSYRLEGEYETRDLVEVLVRRGGQAMRGLFLARRASRAGQPLFSGRRVSLRHGRHATIGASTIIGDDVLMDALSEGGLHLGRNVTIGRGSTLTCTGVVARPGIGIWIGDRTGIGEYAHIGGQGGVRIGSDVIIGPGLRIFSEDHRHDRLDQRIREQGESRREVVIEDDCWLGAGVIVVAGVRIGTGSVIGAGAVVTTDLPARSIAVGVPARVIGTRGVASTPADEERPG